MVPVRDGVKNERRIDGGGHFMFFQNKHKEVLLAIKEGAEELALRRSGHD